MTRLIAVTGFTGYVGRFVAAELVQHEVIIRGLSRPDSDRGGFNTPIEWIAGDLRDPNAISALVNGADTVIHLAYEHAPDKYRGGEGDDLAVWLDANVNGSFRLLTTARDAGVQRFIFLSSRAVFSHTEPNRVLDESHPVSPDTHYGAYKVAVEAFLRSFAHVHGMSTYSVRATGIYGLTWPPHRSKWWTLVQAVLHDQPINTTRGGTEVHGRDVARLIWQLTTQSEQSYDIIHMSDLYVTTRDVVRLIRRFTGRLGSVPELPDKPSENQLVCRRLMEMGFQLGGLPLLEKTIAELVSAAQ